MKMNPLKPLEMPLSGTALIEASAGTGKTFTLTTLFLRLLIERKLGVDQILVVTFTIAATEELKIKIRQRVATALDWVRRDCVAQMAASDEDEVLAKLLSAHSRQTLLTLLGDAVARLDEASIYTIDAFCLRVLEDRAFESGLPFRMEFVHDESAIRAIAVRDHWRRASENYSEELRALLLKEYVQPDKLELTLEPLLRLAQVDVIPPVDGQLVAKLEIALKQQFQKILASWASDAEAIVEILLRDSGISRARIRVATAEQLIAQTHEMVSGQKLPINLAKNFKFFTASNMRTVMKKGFSAPEHPFFDLCDGFPEAFEKLQRLRKVFLVSDAWSQVRKGMREYKQARALMHFEDLRVRLDEALKSENSERLATAVRARWPVAMIDEFQDTDPQQYRMFKTIYHQQQDTSLYLIGDPKQAIYSFRGADIFTYIAARRELDASQCFTLDVNWRSEQRLIQAVNSLFSLPRDAFIYASDIPFHPVRARPGADDQPFILNGKAPAPMRIWMLESQVAGQQAAQAGTSSVSNPVITATDARTQVAAACASDIAQLLNRAAVGQASIGGRAIEAADIAVLVRSHWDGQVIQQHLRAAGIRSVSLGSRSVFESREAQELAVVLRAIATPSVSGVVREALVTQMIGFSASQLDQLNQDEQAWDELIQHFQVFYAVWNQRGVLAAVLIMFNTLQVSTTLLRYVDGEQRVTNLMQVAEILQVTARQLPTAGDLLSWLDGKLIEPSFDDELLLRLESDEALVRIVTVHKSKGLEYPIVYYPFPWTGSHTTSTTHALFHQPDTLQSTVDLGSGDFDAHRMLQGTESKAEELRLVYVALTRARNYCVISWGPIKNAEKSALSWLLYQKPAELAPDNEGPVELQNLTAASTAEITSQLSPLVQHAQGSIELCALPAVGAKLEAVTNQYENLMLQSFAGYIDRDWGITSYTRMIQGIEAEQPDHDDVAVIAEDAQLSVQPVADDDSKIVFDLPAGAHTGQLLHDLLENLDFATASGDALQSSVEQALVHHAMPGMHPREVQKSIALLIYNTLGTLLTQPSSQGPAMPADVVPFALCDIDNRCRLNELEFHFSINSPGARGLQRVLEDSDRYPVAARLLGGVMHGSLKGLMRGFIDMVVRRDGRYFIVDYKSNRLGGSLDDYGTTPIADAISSHHYDLQYLVYTVALHRYLATRLPDYDYEQHFGGIFYLFLRGMRPGHNSGIWFDRPSADLIVALDREFAGDSPLEQAQAR